jgi:hypothetical protein
MLTHCPCVTPTQELQMLRDDVDLSSDVALPWDEILRGFGEQIEVGEPCDDDDDEEEDDDDDDEEEKNDDEEEEEEEENDDEDDQDDDDENDDEDDDERLGG